MLTKPALLVLSDGSVFEGISIGESGDAVGELVFNTAMSGYQEILTDPSYAKQIVTLTTAHVGNTGCNAEDLESSRAWASGLVVRECSFYPSNYRSNQSLPEWLKKQKVVAIAGIDTRKLTLHLRDKGSINACITTQVNCHEKALARAKAFSSLEGLDLAIEVSRQTIERWHEGQGSWGEGSQPHHFHVVVYDFGVKHSILRILHDRGCHITIVPAKTPATEVMLLNPDGVLLSNGPGDPQACDYAIDATKQFLKKKIPILGICLGFQILALACEAKTIKMKFGHHGANHPVIETELPYRVFITSQNHGFAVEESSLPPHLTITHRSLFDNSLQGIRHLNSPALGVQGHPEANPGPHEMESIFTQFISLMQKNTKKDIA